MAKRLSKDSVHYVDNQLFSQKVSEYSKAYRAAVAEGKETPQVSNYIGSCIIKIASRLATSGKFSQYSYKDEMIADGIENILRYLHNFDPAVAESKGKVPNAFSYVTTVIYYAFLRRIDKEKKEQYIKEKNIEMVGILADGISMQGSDDRKFKSDLMSMMTNGLNNLDYDEKRKAKKKKIADAKLLKEAGVDLELED